MRSRITPIALAAVLLMSALPASADAVDSAVNGSRTAPLPNRSELESVAAASASRQAAAGALSHAWLGGLTSVCSSAGEIVGAGPSIGAIFDLFRASAAHAPLLTSSSWTAMGTAAVTGADGAIYVSVVFCIEFTPPSSPATSPPPPPPSNATTRQVLVVKAGIAAAPVPAVPAMASFREVFLKLVMGELEEEWSTVVSQFVLAPRIGPSPFLAPADWPTTTIPAVG